MIETFGVKYIGSKKQLVNNILALSHGKSVIDVFTGTTRVAQAYKQNGYKVYTSDLSWASEAYAYTFIANKNNTHLQKYIDELNAMPGYPGWITKNYCDVITDTGGIVRVWQKKNGVKADAIRDKIEEYDLEHWEKMTLITSLLFALDKVDNTVGVQQAYLKNWCSRSYNDMFLILPPYISGVQGEHIVGDALKIQYPKADIAYLDPPYSAHSYATYYHIWDSITRWDKPDVALKTNRRIDRTKDAMDKDMVSLWNSKRTVEEAFIRLITRLDVSTVLISYNDESLITPKTIIDISSRFGKVSIEEIDYTRNVMATIGNAALYKQDGHKTENKEIIIAIQKH